MPLRERVGVRLSVAVALSALVHLSLICEVQVGSRRQPVTSRIDVQRVEPVLRVQLDRRSLPAPVPPAVQQTKPALAVRSQNRAELAEQTTGASPTDEAAPPAPPPVSDARHPDLEVPAIVDPAWYEARDLDLLPRLLDPVTPGYPAQSPPDFVAELTVALNIDEYGAVQDARVLSTNADAAFEESALAAFRAARFVPAHKDGRIVRSLIAVRVRMAPPQTLSPEQAAAR